MLCVIESRKPLDHFVLVKIDVMNNKSQNLLNCIVSEA